tara:strand:+ start:130 stop:723 length:594 start_codon:yes stop_codon:yes gene_type:complete
VDEKVLQKVIRAPGGLSRILSSINCAAQSSGAGSSKQSTPAKDKAQSKAPESTANPPVTPAPTPVAATPAALPSSSPPASKQRKVTVVKSLPGRGKRKTCEVSYAVPEGEKVPVCIKDVRGEFFFRRGPKDYRVRITTEDGTSKDISPAAFEQHAGLKRGKWRRSISLVKTEPASDAQEPDMHIGEFLDAFEALPKD